MIRLKVIGVSHKQHHVHFILCLLRTYVAILQSLNQTGFKKIKKNNGEGSRKTQLFQFSIYIQHCCNPEIRIAKLNRLVPTRTTAKQFGISCVLNTHQRALHVQFSPVLIQKNNASTSVPLCFHTFNTTVTFTMGHSHQNG